MSEIQHSAAVTAVAVTFHLGTRRNVRAMLNTNRPTPTVSTRAEVPDLFHVPLPEHPDHADEADEVKRELPARQPFAVKFGFERHRHELIHRAHDDGADPAQHEQMRQRR